MRWPWQELVDEAGRPGLTLGECLIVFLAGVLAFALAAPALGQGAGFTDKECRALAYFARMSAEIRDLDADLEKHVALVRRRVAQGGSALSPIVEGELRRVYAEGLEPERAEERAYTRCMTGEILQREG